MKAFSKRGLQAELGNTRTGRILLHFFCALRHPEHAGWHWRGIVREFPHHTAGRPGDLTRATAI